MITTIVAIIFWITTPMGATVEAWEVLNYVKPRIILGMYIVSFILSIIATIEVRRQQRKKEDLE